MQVFARRIKIVAKNSTFFHADDLGKDVDMYRNMLINTISAANEAPKAILKLEITNVAKKSAFRDAKKRKC